METLQIMSKTASGQVLVVRYLGFPIFFASITPEIAEVLCARNLSVSADNVKFLFESSCEKEAVFQVIFLVAKTLLLVCTMVL